jgi:hypothetical protein
MLRFCEDAGVHRWLLAMTVVGCGLVRFDPVPDASLGPDVSDGAPAVLPWELVQTASADNAAPSNATVNLKPLGRGHLVVVAVQVDSHGLVTNVTDSSLCNNYLPIPTSLSTSMALDVTLQLFYAKSSCPDANAISITATATVSAAAVWEVAGIRTDEPLDTATVLNDQSASDRPLGPKITTSAAGEFVVAVALVDHLITGIHAGNEFTNDQNNQGNGWGHLTDPQSAAGLHQAQWEQTPAGPYCSTAAAFQVGP